MKEKTWNKILIGISLYKTFDAAYDADSQTASFDVEKNGTCDIWFVANAMPVWFGKPGGG